MKIKMKQTDYMLNVRVRTSFGEHIDEKELDRFAREHFIGFLKPKKIRRNLFEYAGPIGISLNEHLGHPMPKRDFLYIIEQIVVAIQKLQANKMSLDCLVTDLHYVFINEATKAMQFLYVPISKNQGNPDVYRFIENITFAVKPGDEDDNEFTSRFIYYFHSIVEQSTETEFDVNAVEEFVFSEDESVVKMIRKRNARQSGFMTDKRKQYYEHYNKEMDDSGDSPTIKFNGDETDDNGDNPTIKFNGDEADDDLTSDLNGNEKTGLLADDELTCDLKNNEEMGLRNSDDGTVPLTGQSYGTRQNNNAYCSMLLRTYTNEKVWINKSVFRIGTERSSVDYYVDHNNAVSREHAEIIKKGNTYFVKDCNSMNHTYINGEELHAYEEVELHEGDHLKLGNEEFIFNI